MDSVTQAALGAAVGGAVAGRRAGWRAFAWGAVVGTLPDLDSFVPFDNPVADFTYHRSYTHALAVQTLAAPLLAAGIRRLDRRGDTPWSHWLLLVWLALVTHALLDAMTIYGTQLWLPFTDYPAGLGSVFIIDPLYTLPLLAGIAGALARRRDWHRARRWNLAGLAVATLYLGWTVGAQQWVESRAAAAIERQGLAAQRMLATPTAFNSLLWRIVAVGDEHYWEGFQLVGSDQPVRFRAHETAPALLSGIDDTWAVRRLRYFTKGFYSVTRRGDGTIVLTDLRMGQSGYYAFAFEVGRRRDGHSVESAVRQHEYPRPDLGVVIDDLFACGRGRATEVMAC